MGIRGLLALSCVVSILFGTFQVHAKPFQRALVIGGGGITPGVALGMIAGAQAAGYNPDVIITTCGASLGASIFNSFGDVNEALAFAKSERFYRSLAGLVRLDSWTVFGLKNKFDGVTANPHLLPELFKDTILGLPESVEGLLPRERFPSGERATKFIVLAARTAIRPGDAGREIGTKPLVKEVFITDSATAKHLRGRRSTVKRIFPDSYLASKTEVLTGIGMSQAARASISDPYYITPARIGDWYYFGGAIDLYPIETATDLADEVLVNYPVGLYSQYEDLAIQSVFGFAQSSRTKVAARHKDVMWLDSSGTNLLSLDPTVNGIFFVNNFPQSHSQYRAAIDRQFEFGYARAVEAVKVQKDRRNVRTHLRHTAVGAG